VKPQLRKGEHMWNDTKKVPVLEFLGWVLLIWGLCVTSILLLEPYSIAFANNGIITVGYVCYAIVGILFDTPTPMIATFIVLKRHKKICSVKDFIRLIFCAPSAARTVLITGVFCAAALFVAIIYGTPTGSPWYLLIAAWPLMIIGGGVEEIGWRGFLQPALEKRFSFPIATVITGIIIYLWHLPLWLQPSSNHYGDSLIGFAIMIFVWAFIGAAIYKSTKSVFACVMYHAFINTIGAVYDWNALFDAFPNKTGMYIYFCFVFVVAIIIWMFADKQRKITKSSTDQYKIIERNEN